MLINTYIYQFDKGCYNSLRLRVVRSMRSLPPLRKQVDRDRDKDRHRDKDRDRDRAEKETETERNREKYRFIFVLP